MLKVFMYFFVFKAVNEETGDQFNLYELAGQVLEFDHHDSKIVVSVCAPINKEQDVNVPCSGPGLAACLIGGKEVVKVLGMLGQSPEVISNGAIRLSYYSKYAAGLIKKIL